METINIIIIILGQNGKGYLSILMERYKEKKWIMGLHINIYMKVLFKAMSAVQHIEIKKKKEKNPAEAQKG